VAHLLVAASIITALVVLAGSRFRHTADGFEAGSWAETYRSATELPCPWCGADTEETDRACPNCHRPFGVTVGT
jgi:rubrerythrin